MWAWAQLGLCAWIHPNFWGFDIIPHKGWGQGTLSLLQDREEMKGGLLILNVSVELLPVKIMFDFWVRRPLLGRFMSLNGRSSWLHFEVTPESSERLYLWLFELSIFFDEVSIFGYRRIRRHLKHIRSYWITLTLASLIETLVNSLFISLIFSSYS